MGVSFRRDKAVQFNNMPVGTFTVKEAKFVSKEKKDKSGTYVTLELILENSKGKEFPYNLFLGKGEDWKVLKKGASVEYTGDNEEIQESGGLPSYTGVFKFFSSIMDINEDLEEAIDENGPAAIEGLVITTDKQFNRRNPQTDKDEFDLIVTEIEGAAGGGDDDDDEDDSSGGGDLEEVAEEAVKAVLEGTKKKQMKVSKLTGKLFSHLKTNKIANADKIVDLCDYTSPAGKKFLDGLDDIEVEYDEDENEGTIKLDA